MPKPLLKPAEAQRTETVSFAPQKSAAKVHDPVLLEKALRKKRSPEYMEAVKNLDLHGVQMDAAAFDGFVAAMKKEFPELFDFSLLLGYLGKCWLGPEYDVHSLDMAGNVIRHYKPGEPLPPAFEKARVLASGGSYEFIEVYTDALRAVRADGTVSVIKN